jgi:hypothetical protein
MSVTEVTPSIWSRTYLAGAQFADAYCIEIEGAALDAGAAALLLLGRSPRWIRILLGLRNIFVAPLGLKTSGEPTAKGIIGLFPVVSATSQRGRFRRSSSRFPDHRGRRAGRQHAPAGHIDHSGTHSQSAWPGLSG